MESLSPIVLFVYNRPWHTRLTVEALQKNTLASNSELFIYTDGEKNSKDRSKVEEVRKYIETINGFKKLVIIKREKNWGLADSIIDGVTKIVNQYGKIIVLEDDLITSPYFLNFMNDALEFYKNEDKVMSISGYTYPFQVPDSYKKDTFLFYRSSSWGWAIWKDEWNSIDFDITNECEIFKNKTLQENFNKGGDDLFDMLKIQMKGEINSWAIRYALSHSLNNKFGLLPIKSLVQNIGYDNSGTHCGITDTWDILLDYSFIPKLNKVHLDDAIIKNMQKKVNKTVFQKIKSFIRRIIT
jgi:hypothetical protein